MHQTPAVADVLACVQNMTVGDAVTTKCIIRSCLENAIGDRMVCELLPEERKALLESEFF